VRTGVIAAAIAAAVVVVVIVVIATTGAGGPAGSHGSHSKANQGPPAPLHLLSVTPAPQSADVPGDTPLQLEFSGPVSAGSPKPTITPALPGTWQALGDMLVFTPETTFAPSTHYTVHIPTGDMGVRSTEGGVLTAAQTVSFSTSPYTQLRLAELMSQLGYLPLSWQQTAAGRLASGPSGGGLATQEAMAYDPPPGNFTWNPGYPATLHTLWAPDRANPLLLGAVYAFKAQHGFTIDASIGQKFWQALFAAADANQVNTVGYTYAIANKGSPETLTIWHNGSEVLHSLANTGIPSAPTVNGTFPVYSRFRQTIMSGTNPDGSHYSDPVSFVSYFNGGDAVHYFPRGGYGYEQSLGCVELPYTNAERAFPYLTYGSLVTVDG
jgi:Big-like domain-containing protein/L,D-transpeptidase-like protein